MITTTRDDKHCGTGESLHTILQLRWLKSLGEKGDRRGKAQNNLESYKADGPTSSDSSFHCHLEPIEKMSDTDCMEEKYYMALQILYTHRINRLGETSFIFTNCRLIFHSTNLPLKIIKGKIFEISPKNERENKVFFLLPWTSLIFFPTKQRFVRGRTCYLSLTVDLILQFSQLWNEGFKFTSHSWED